MSPPPAAPNLPPQGLWAFAGGKFYGYLFCSPKEKIDHVSWFRDLGLPDFGPDFDRILRGRMTWDVHADHYVLSYYGMALLPNQVYHKVTCFFDVNQANVVEKPIRAHWLRG